MRHRLMAAMAAMGVLGAMLIAASGASAATFDCSVPLDNFNRANGGLGSNWSEQAATVNVENNSATNPNSTTGLATWNKLVPTQQACVDVSDNGAAVQYAGLVLGFGDVDNNAFLKVQDNLSAGTFQTAFIYYGNNNSSCKITGGCNFPITPFHAGRLHASLDPATAQVTLDIDTNFDNVPEQSITRSFNAPFNFGNAIGISAYGHSFLDNFATSPAPPTPAPTPTPTPTPAPTPTPTPKPKPLKCKKGFVKKKKSNGKVKCVKRHKKHHKKH